MDVTFRYAAPRFVDSYTIYYLVIVFSTGDIVRLTTTAICILRPTLREICLAMPLDWRPNIEFYTSTKSIKGAPSRAESASVTMRYRECEYYRQECLVLLYYSTVSWWRSCGFIKRTKWDGKEHVGKRGRARDRSRYHYFIRTRPTEFRQRYVTCKQCAWARILRQNERQVSHGAVRFHKQISVDAFRVDREAVSMTHATLTMSCAASQYMYSLEFRRIPILFIGTPETYVVRAYRSDGGGQWRRECGCRP